MNAPLPFDNLKVQFSPRVKCPFDCVGSMEVVIESEENLLRCWNNECLAHKYRYKIIPVTATRIK